MEPLNNGTVKGQFNYLWNDVIIKFYFNIINDIKIKYFQTSGSRFVNDSNCTEKWASKRY